MNKDKSYRIRTQVGSETEKVLYVNLEQTYDTLDILSLKINQTNAYKLYQSDYGVVVGRVYANGGFGVPNAKISVFIESTEEWGSIMNVLYPYASLSSTNTEGIRYNLLPDEVDDICHQDVGTFPHKRLVLDNNDIIEVFDKYFKYTTTTNNAGDYMLFGVPTGSHSIHMDVDLSDVGILSQRPRDMIYKGYNITMFESPNKFKTDTNLGSLPQIQSQDTSLFVYPYWGDTTDSSDLIAVTRCDISLNYKFEPTCVFMGSVVTSTGTNAINKDCSSSEMLGRMDRMVTGEGTIEMIRKRFDNKTEQFSIEGNRLIDSNGVWCYQIPMNLDYIITDEFGNIVPSDNPEIGIPTRTRVRFRVSIDDITDDEKARNRCKYLVPNNPHMDEELYPYFTEHFNSSQLNDAGIDYEFGTKTKDENFRDLFWNKVYTVKNYIPRIQKGTYGKNNRKYCGIKMVNHYGDNNPMPYNNLNIKLGFTYKLLCVIIKIIINLISFLNNIITLIAIIPCILYKFFNGCSKIWLIGVICKPFRNAFHAAIPSCVALNSEFCGDEVTHKYTYYPGCGKFLGASLGSWAGCVADITRERHNKKQVNGVEVEDRTTAVFGFGELMNCVENSLAEEHDALSLNFTNDWINGCLFMPMWYRRITPKKKFLFWTIHRAKDQYCGYNSVFNSLYTLQVCAVPKTSTVKYDSIYEEKGKTVGHIMNGTSKGTCGKNNRDCDKIKTHMRIPTGIVVSKTTIDEKTVYYYKAGSKLYNNDNSETRFGRLFATDIVLLGSLNEIDVDGIPQFFKSLESTTYNEPNSLLVASTDIAVDVASDFDEEPSYYQYLTSHEEANIEQQTRGVSTNLIATVISEQTGKDWGNTNEDLCNGKKKIKEGDNAGDSDAGGLFYGIGCSDTDVRPKSCINLSRICEYGVLLDSSSIIETDLEGSENVTDGSLTKYERLSPDGYISKDDIYDDDGRTAFATMNGNNLRTVYDYETGIRRYVFKTLIVDNFDGSLYNLMKNAQTSCGQSPKYNYYLENFSDGYYDFRMGRGDFNLTDKNSNPDRYYYDSNNSFPVYDNSFYFYFGLKAGKTAIEKFNSIYFSECSDAEDTEKISFMTKAMDWCSKIKNNTDDNGYVTFNLEEVNVPCTIYLSPVTTNPNDTFTYTIYSDTYERVYLSQVSNSELEKEGYFKVEAKRSDQSADSFIQYIDNGVYRMTVEDADGNIYEDVLNLTPPGMSCVTVKTNFTYSMEEFLDMYDGWSYENILTDKRINEKTLTEDGEYTVNTTRIIGGTVVMAAPTDSTSGETLPHYIAMLELVNSSYVEINIFEEDYPDKYWREISEAEYLRLVDDENNNVIEKNGGYWREITKDEYDQLKMNQYAAAITVHDGAVAWNVEENNTTVYEYDSDRIIVDNINDVKVIIFQIPKDNAEYLLTIKQKCENNEGEYVECDNIYTERFFVNVKQPFKLIINETVDYDVIKDWNCGFHVAKTGNKKYIEGNGTGISKNWWHMSDINIYNWEKYVAYQEVDNEIIELFTAIKNNLNSLKENEDALYEVFDVILSYLYKVDENVKVLIDNVIQNVGLYGTEEESVVQTFLYNNKDSNNRKCEVDLETTKTALMRINETLANSRYEITGTLSKSEYNSLSEEDKTKYRPITYCRIIVIDEETYNGLTPSEKAEYTLFAYGNVCERITPEEYEELETSEMGNYTPLYKKDGNNSISFGEYEELPKQEDCSKRYHLNKYINAIWTKKIVIDEETYNGLTPSEKAEYTLFAYSDGNERITPEEYEELETSEMGNYTPLYKRETKLEDNEQAEYWVYCYQTQDGDVYKEEILNEDEPRISPYITFYTNGKALNFNEDVNVEEKPHIEGNEMRGEINLPYSYVYDEKDAQLNWFEKMEYLSQGDFEPCEYINVETFNVSVYIKELDTEKNCENGNNIYYTTLHSAVEDCTNQYKLLSDGKTIYCYENASNESVINSSDECVSVYIPEEWNSNVESEWNVKWDNAFITAVVASGIETEEDNEGIVGNTIDDIINMNETINENIDVIPSLKKSFINQVKSAFMITCKGQTKLMTFSALTDDLPVEYNVVFRNEMLPEDVQDPDFNVLEAKDTAIDKDGSLIENITIPTIINVDDKDYGNSIHYVPDSNNKLCFARDNYYPSSGSDKYWKKAFFIGVKNRVGDTIPRTEEETIETKYFGFHILGKPLDVQCVSWANIKSIPYYALSDENIGDKVGKTVTLSGLLSGEIYNGIISRNEIENGYNMTFFIEQSVGVNQLKIYTPIPNNLNAETVEDEIPTKRYVVGSYTMDRVINLLKQYVDKLSLNIILDNAYKIHIYYNEQIEIIDEYEWSLKNASEQEAYTMVQNGIYKVITSDDYEMLEDEEKPFYEMVWYYYSESDIVENTGNSSSSPLDNALQPYKFIKLGDNEYIRYVLSITDDIVITRFLSIEDFMSYKGYKCVNDYNSNQQYVTLLPTDSDMTINDEADCYVDRFVDANMKITLSSGSINDCRHKVKDESSVFDVDCDNSSAESVTFYAFEVSTDTANKVGTSYPLNKAKNIPSVSGVDLPISYIDVNSSANVEDDEFDYDKLEYLFSTATKPQKNGSSMYLGKVRTTSNLISTNEGEGGTKTFTGYSTTGSFTLKDDKGKYESRCYSHRPYYIVAITNDNARAISPVYDYTYVDFVIQYGKLTQKIAEFDENEQPTEDTITTYGFMVDIENVKDCYYFANYRYTIDLYTKMTEETAYLGRTYHEPANNSSFGTIIENSYAKELYDRNEAFTAGMLMRILNLEAKATDMTGLIHYNVFYDNTSFEDMRRKDWFVISWSPNGGTWKYNNTFTNSTFYGSEDIVTKTFVSGDNYDIFAAGNVASPQVEHINEYGVELDFSGWSKSDGTLISNGSVSNLNSSEIYYAKWDLNNLNTRAITIEWRNGYDTGDSGLIKKDYIPRGKKTCVELPSKPVRIGYRFTGWEYNGASIGKMSGCYNVDDTGTTHTSPMTFIAQWEELPKYTVNIKLVNESEWIGEGSGGGHVMLQPQNLKIRFSFQNYNTVEYHSLNIGSVLQNNSVYIDNVADIRVSENEQTPSNFKVHSLLFETKDFNQDAKYLYSIGRNADQNLNYTIQTLYEYSGVKDNDGNWMPCGGDDTCGIVIVDPLHMTEEYGGKTYYVITLGNLYDTR